ncbi:Valyl-tRNA synthetase [Nostocoides japonicum T1-X7]|uniref:Valine--tRNA ligase n=1 Tax=Nostocoides japonicum T1-X7 TaxID=1194083 RepID=A0A077M190_9MICO|nr:valine--tRNA ligase [Tetrasphaera japonica]CCH80098.1 Valyl-tRNA synthetase [Tetrasphaera japonica T1-X7]
MTIAEPTRATAIPERPSIDGLEDKWAPVWEEQGVFAFDRSILDERGREGVYAIDTPPPTASGSLHVGHVFSYTHTDLVARYKRMAGYEVFFPIGWDDNGLPTERRVQNYYGVRGDASLPYDPDFTPPREGGEGKSVKAADQVPVSRQNFIELCDILTVKDEETFEDLWRRLGMSYDWSLSYRTIDDHSRATAQQMFLRNLAKGEAYAADAPGLWDVTFQTAVAQAELEARDYPGHYHRVAFHRTDADAPVFIETTRPELLPACVALIAHPDDERYQGLFGKTVRSPLFQVELPVLAHPDAEMDKGAGIAMCCTFGDLTDVTWWRELRLPTRSIVTRTGRLLGEAPAWITHEAGIAAYEGLAGRTTFSARAAVVDLLRESGDLVGEPTPTQRKANFYENGEKPLEIVTSRQWYIRNGGRDADLNAALIERGREIAFHPSFMRARYENWVGGLNGDWLISRQRFFGVAIPVWYAVGADGEPDRDALILPREDQLPVDPAAQPAPGYDESQRGVPGGFVGDTDIMDTWATSSLTPQIALDWRGGEGDAGSLWSQIFPMDLRAQAQDIIRTWLFSTVVRSHFAENTVPWHHAAISGWILDPDRKKMGKSKGNAETPEGMVKEYGADGVRYWAASAKLGTDAAFDIGQMKVGRRLAIKVLNASKFALSFGEEPAGVSGGAGGSAALRRAVTVDVDRSMLTALADVVGKATAAFDAYDHARALEVTEAFFWTFCDDYLELVKDRAYGGQGEAAAQSARAALRIALEVLLRLLAPFLPYATEEVWSWFHDGSVHRASWPVPAEADVPAGSVSPAVLAGLGGALAGIRKAKSEAKTGMRAEIARVTIAADPAAVSGIRAGEADLRAAGRVTGDIDFADAATLEVRDAVVVPVERTPR